MPLQHTARPRIDPDIDLKFEPGMGAGIDRVRSHGARVLLHPRGGCQLVWHFPCQLRGISKSLTLRGEQVRRTSESQRSRTSTLEIDNTCETSCRNRTVGLRFQAPAGATPRGSLAASLWPTDMLPRRFRGSPARWLQQRRPSLPLHRGSSVGLVQVGHCSWALLYLRKGSPFRETLLLLTKVSALTFLFEQLHHHTEEREPCLCVVFTIR